MNTVIEFPGLIDCHVHFREPGYEQKGTMASEAAAAHAGGVVTVCDMPNTNPPTVTVEALQDKIHRAATVRDCDIYFFFGATQLEHLRAFEEAWGSPKLRERLAGLKLYFDHSTGNQKAEAKVIEAAFQTCAKLGSPLVAHCEDPEVNAEAASRIPLTDIAAHSERRPPGSEERAVSRAIALTKKYGTHLHIAHLSTSLGLELVRRAKRDGLPVTCEVAPHHLFMTVEDYATLGTLGKVNPPLREHADRDALWEAIADGTIDCVASDHAPHSLREKCAASPLSASSGIPGVETMLPLLLTVAAGRWPGYKLQATSYKLHYLDIKRLCFTNPNTIFSLQKDHSEAEKVLIHSEEEWVIRGSDLHYKCGWTPYERWKVKGRVQKVFRPLQQEE